MTQQQETRVANYYNTIVPVMQATEIINTKTGEVLTPSIYDKLVYCYILHYHDLYSAKGKGMFESQDSIADNFGIDRKTVNRSVKKLTSIGLLSKKVTLEIKGNTKRKHATYFPYDVRLGIDFLFRQKVVVRDEEGFGVEQCFEYGVVPVKAVKQEKTATEEKRVVMQTDVYETPEPPKDHPVCADIPLDEDFEQVAKEIVKPKTNPTTAYYDDEAIL